MLERVMKRVVWRRRWAGWMLRGGLLLVLVAGAVWAYLNWNAQGRVIETVVERTDELGARLDVRCSSLDAKLDRIEGKLDRLLQLANPPLPDGVRPAR